MKKRKLAAGQIVVARNRSSPGQSGRTWQPAKVVKADGQGNYRYKLYIDTYLGVDNNTHF